MVKQLPQNEVQLRRLANSQGLRTDQINKKTDSTEPDFNKFESNRAFHIAALAEKLEAKGYDTSKIYDIFQVEKAYRYETVQQGETVQEQERQKFISSERRQERIKRVTPQDQLRNIDRAVKEGKLSTTEAESLREQVRNPERFQRQQRVTEQRETTIDTPQPSADAILGSLRAQTSDFQTYENLRTIAQESTKLRPSPEPKLKPITNFTIPTPSKEIYGPPKPTLNFQRTPSSQETITVQTTPRLEQPNEFILYPHTMGAYKKGELSSEFKGLEKTARARAFGSKAQKFYSTLKSEGMANLKSSAPELGFFAATIVLAPPVATVVGAASLPFFARDVQKSIAREGALTTAAKVGPTVVAAGVVSKTPRIKAAVNKATFDLKIKSFEKRVTDPNFKFDGRKQVSDIKFSNVLSAETPKGRVDLFHMKIEKTPRGQYVFDEAGNIQGRQLTLTGKTDPYYNAQPKQPALDPKLLEPFKTEGPFKPPEQVKQLKLSQYPQITTGHRPSKVHKFIDIVEKPKGDRQQFFAEFAIEQASKGIKLSKPYTTVPRSKTKITTQPDRGLTQMFKSKKGQISLQKQTEMFGESKYYEAPSRPKPPLPRPKTDVKLDSLSTVSYFPKVSNKIQPITRNNIINRARSSSRFDVRVRNIINEDTDYFESVGLRSGVTPKSAVRQATSTRPALITKQASKLKTPPDRVPDFTGTPTTIPPATPPKPPKTPPFKLPSIKSDIQVFPKLAKAIDKKKKPRKFRGTPSLSVVGLGKGAAGTQLTKGQLLGKELISPLTIRKI